MIKASRKLHSLQATLRKHNEMHSKICAQAADIMNNLHAAMAVIADKDSYTKAEYKKLIYWVQQYKWTMEMFERYHGVLEDHLIHVSDIGIKGQENVAKILQELGLKAPDGK